MKIVVLERNSVGLDVSVDCFKDFGEMVCYSNTVTEEEVALRCVDADIIVANKAPLNEASLKECKNLKLICEFATGYDNCALEYLKNRNVLVCNVKDYSTDMVAQHSFALALMLCENLSFYDDYVKSGKYSAQDRFSNFDAPISELAGKTWGIIGMGNIGQKVAKIATAFGCRVFFHSVTGKSKVTDYPMVDKDTLLAESDFLSIHCPLSDLTRDFIDADALKKMKKSAILINVARGPVVNNTDLFNALEAGEITAAGLDVLEKEPLENSNPLSKIMDSGRLVITPHNAWASFEARNRLVLGVYGNIKNFLAKTPTNVVNG